jgi:hypothetical protein
MAGLFRAPKPVVSPPAPPSAAPPAPGPAPASATLPTAEDTRIASRISARQGTIATSPRGVLAPLPILLTRKSLLGE